MNVVLLTLIFVGGIVFGQAEAPASARPQQQPVASDWQRTKDCTERVDFLARRDRWNADKLLLGKESHYSPTFERCFVKLSRMNDEAKKDPTYLPTTYYELWDAFEEKLQAVCTDDSRTGGGTFCSVQDDKQHFRDCDYCRSFTKERMTK